MPAKQAISLLKESYAKWSKHQAPRLGASVAFYSILSFAPLLVLIAAVIALVFGHESAQAALVNESRQWIGDRGAETVQTLLKNAQKPASGAFASLIAFMTLLFGASGVFTELREALNVMWDAKAQTASGFVGLIKERLFSFGMVLSIGFLLLVSLMLSAALAFIGGSFKQVLPVPPIALQVTNFAFSFAVITVLFLLMFRYVPAVKAPWRETFIGAVGTALLFTLGKFLLGLYLGKASVGSTYGAAGSFVAMIVWIYYSAQIFFFGAQFTRVYAEAHGAKIDSAPSSVPDRVPSGSAPLPPEPVQTAELATGTAANFGQTTPARSSAAAAADTSVQAVSSMPYELVTGAGGTPVSTLPGERVTRASESSVSRETKPRLLMAAALGFVLGRVFGAVHNGRPGHEVRE